MSTVFDLKPGELTLDNMHQFMLEMPSLKLQADAQVPIDAAHQIVQDILNEDKVVYGINTGFGSLAHQIISKNQLEHLQKNIILSHATGTGELLSDDVVAMILVLKINALAQGYSGVRYQLIEWLVTLYNHKIYPCIPSRGSVGASGDLAPLAHMSLPILGQGTVRYKQKIMNSMDALNEVGIKAIPLHPKEGLALLNGLQATTAILLKAFFLTEYIFDAAMLSGCLSVDAVKGSDTPFDARIQRVRRHKAQMWVAEQYQALLKGSEIRDSHKHCQKVQDPYSLRCQPQVMGAIWHQIAFVRDTLAVEINAVTDNPLVFAKEKDILSGGNFHGEILAMSADNLALAISEIGALSERRIALLIDKNLSGLPAFLVKESGLNSGFMIAHVSAAACASDNKALSHPHSVDSIPTSANQEDHVSMATSAARRLLMMVDNCATIIAIELLAACQGIEYHAPQKTSKALLSVYNKVREQVASYQEDRFFAPDIDSIKSLILKGVFRLNYFI